jgi:uncharacterized protein YggE
MDTFFDVSDKKKIGKYVLVLVIILSVFVGVKALSTLKEFSYIGKNVYPQTAITVTGRGEVMASPDVASFVFSVQEEGSNTKLAQDKATEKTNAIIAALKKAGIDEKDIKTLAYNVSPKYEYSNAVCTQYSCPPSKSTIVGYQISQDIQVKVRKIDTAGEMLSLAGGFKVSYISDLSFVIDQPETLRAEARQKAIAEAKEKAKTLSKQLGVRLVKVTSFYEDNGNYNPGIMMKADSPMGMGGDYSIQSSAPVLPTGENTIVSNVTLTYEME